VRHFPPQIQGIQNPPGLPVSVYRCIDTGCYPGATFPELMPCQASCSGIQHQGQFAPKRP